VAVSSWVSDSISSWFAGIGTQGVLWHPCLLKVGVSSWCKFSGATAQTFTQAPHGSYRPYKLLWLKFVWVPGCCSLHVQRCLVVSQQWQPELRWLGKMLLLHWAVKLDLGASVQGLLQHRLLACGIRAPELQLGNCQRLWRAFLPARPGKSLLGNSQAANVQCSGELANAQVDTGWTCFNLFVGINHLIFGEHASSRYLTTCI